MNRQIKCDLHDYVEVMCLFNYELEIVTIENEIIYGKALDVKNMKGKGEYLKIIHENQIDNIFLDKIEKINVLTNNARFTQVKFK